MSPYLFFERFAAEYPGRASPIGMIAAVQRNPKYDSEFSVPESRSNGSGRILSFSHAEGWWLRFEVEHIERRGDSAAGTTSAWYDVDEILYLMDPSSWLTTSITLDFGPLNSVSIGPCATLSNEPFPVDLDEVVREL